MTDRYYTVTAASSVGGLVHLSLRSAEDFGTFPLTLCQLPARGGAATAPDCLTCIGTALAYDRQFDRIMREAYVQGYTR